MATAKATRKVTEVWLIGQPNPQTMMGKQLPSLREALSRFFYFHNQGKKTVSEAASLVVEEVFLFWEKARISTKEKHHAAKKLTNEYELWRALGRNKSRKSTTETKKREQFVTSLDHLFDVAMQDVELTLNEEDQRFLTMQRNNGGRKGVMLGIDGKLAALEKRRMNRSRKRPAASEEETVELASSCSSIASSTADGDDDSDGCAGPSSAPSPPKRSRARASAVTQQLAAALDRTRTSDRSAVHILRAAADAYSPIPSNLAVNRQSIRRHRRRVREDVAKEIRETFAPSVPLVVHWDGKIIADSTDVTAAERLPVLVSGDGVNKLLGVPRLPSGKGNDVATAVISCLEDWGIAERVVGMSFDTTASNTGVRAGACTYVQQRLDRNLLHLACRHHILEIVADKSFGVCFAPSSGPDIQLFKRFKAGWKSIDQMAFQPIQSIPTTSDEIIMFCQEKLQATQPRDDYRELLILTIVVLGGIPTGGIRMCKPGAYHRARWMGKLIYALKIFLFRGQFKLTKVEEQNLARFVLFIVTLYVPAWYEAPLATRAPAQDLAFYRSLVSYEDKEIGREASKAFGRHLWYISEELVSLALFDESTTLEDKRLIVAAFDCEGAEDPPKRISLKPDLPVLTRHTLADFASSNSRFLLTALGPSDFLDVDPAEWPARQDYQLARRRAESLNVVNDFAERGVALIQSYSAIITKDEEQRQFLLQVVEDHRRRFPEAKR